MANVLRGVEQSIKNSPAVRNTVRGGVVLFWFVAGLAVGKDILDILSVVLDAIGLGLSATVVAAPIGIPLAFFSEILDKIAGLLYDFIMVTYFAFIGGRLSARIVVVSVGAIIDAIPVLDVLPLTTLTFFLAFALGKKMNSAIQSKTASATLGKISNTNLGNKVISSL